MAAATTRCGLASDELLHGAARPTVGVLVTSTSAWRSSSAKRSRSPASSRSRATPSLPALRTANDSETPWRIGASPRAGDPSGGSTFTTSAPRSPSSRGASSACSTVRSTTRSPVSGSTRPSVIVPPRTRPGAPPRPDRRRYQPGRGVRCPGATGSRPAAGAQWSRTVTERRRRSRWCSTARVARWSTSWVAGDGGLGQRLVEPAAEDHLQQLDRLGRHRLAPPAGAAQQAAGLRGRRPRAARRRRRTARTRRPRGGSPRAPAPSRRTRAPPAASRRRRACAAPPSEHLVEPGVDLALLRQLVDGLEHGRGPGEAVEVVAQRRGSGRSSRPG